MNYSTNMYNQEYEVMNGICLGGPEHMQIMNISDGDYLRVAEFPSINIHGYSLFDSAMLDSTIDIHTYYKKIAHIQGHIRRFRAYIYVHSEIPDGEVDQWLYNYYPDIYYRIRYDYDNRCYKFFNSPDERYIHDYQNSTWRHFNIPPDFQPEEGIQYSPAGINKSKETRNSKKVKIKLDDELFEL